MRLISNVVEYTRIHVCTMFEDVLSTGCVREKGKCRARNIFLPKNNGHIPLNL